ncbi:MAG TPA: sigma factor, partial [Acidimicrobiales bacterium]
MVDDQRAATTRVPERSGRSSARHQLPNDVSARLVRQARTGDNQAFARLVEHYDQRLRGLIYELLDHPSSVDEVLHATYLRAYRALPRLTPQQSAGAWLYRIAYLACTDELRRQHRGRRRGAPRAIDTDDPVARRLLALPVDDRALVLMVDRDG